jgi:hypothetical protein
MWAGVLLFTIHVQAGPGVSLVLSTEEEYVIFLAVK